MPRISVLIPTLGREIELIDTIKALMAQTRVPDEIVVVDQNVPSIPSVDQLLSSIDRVKHIRSDRSGYSWNLNICLREATGDIVLFLDDDVSIDPRLVEYHLAHYNDESLKKGIVGVAGRVEQPKGDLAPDKIRTVGRYRRWTGKVIANFNAIHASEVQIAAGGNMSFLRKVLEEVGGVDPGFDGNGYRCETDLCLRVVARGYRLFFEPRAQLVHLMAPRGGCRTDDKALHTYYYVKNGIRLYRKHSPRIGVPLFILQMAGYVALKAVYNLSPRILTVGWKALIPLEPSKLANS